MDPKMFLYHAQSIASDEHVGLEKARSLQHVELFCMACNGVLLLDLTLK